jgi:hypothetical protein
VSDVRVSPKNNERRIYVMIALVFCVGLFAYRVALFLDIEPRSDQAFFSWWVQGLAQADHILPTSRAGESFLAALERDDGSFLHRLLRPIHGKSITIFTSVPLTLRLMAAWVFGDGIEVQTISGIFTGTMIILAIGLLGVWSLKIRPGNLSSRSIDGIAILVVILTGGTYYLHYYSPLGNHNFGVLFLTLAMGATQQAISALEDNQKDNFRLIVIAIFLQFLALYSHWTNIFLLPASTLLVGLFSSISPRRKIIITWYYFTFLLMIAAPFLLFAINDLGHAGNPRNHTVWDLLLIAFDSVVVDYVKVWGERALRWFDNLSSILSSFGVAFGLLGTFVLAIRQRIYFPLSLCATHFLMAILLPIFMGAHFRTDLYIIPFLNMGLAYIVVLSLSEVLNFKRSRRISVMAIVGVVIITLTSHHLWQQASKIGPSDIMRHQNPEFWEAYYKGQGELRQMAKEIDQILPESAVVFTWGYGMQFFIRNYGVVDVRRKIMPSLLTLISRFDNDTLSQLIKRRDISIQAGTPIYVLTDHHLDNVDPVTLRRGVANTLGPEGFDLMKKVQLVRKLERNFVSSWPRNIVLYRVSTD